MDASKHTLVGVGADYFACYFIDDRAAVTGLQETAAWLPAQGCCVCRH